MRLSVFSLWILSLVSLVCVNVVSSVNCPKRIKYDNKEFFSCPGPQDPPEARHCCGRDGLSFCCSDGNLNQSSWIGERPDTTDPSNLYDDEGPIPNLSDSVAERASIVQGLAKLVGIVIGVALFVVIVCVVCCCCCPFCFFAKRRNRGQVIRTNEQGLQPQPNQPPPPAGIAYTIPPEQFQQQGMLPQQGMMAYPPQPSTPMGSMAYPPGMAYPPSQQGYALSQQGYPQPTYLPGSYPQGVAYPQQAPLTAPPPYPGGPMDGNPPLEKMSYQNQPAYNPNY